MKSLTTALATLVLLVSAGTPRLAKAQTTESHPPAFTLDGELALWTVAIKPDKTADFERVLARLRDALSKSQNPVRRQQSAGWKVIKVEKPMPDGNIAYVHVISPVVKGADYAVMQTLYEELPNERQELYELYRGAFAQNLALTAGSVVMQPAAPQ
jgi:hypothetical protein